MLALLISLALVPSALAVPVNINDVELEAAGGVIFDPDDDADANIDGVWYTPVDDGSTPSQTDAFDSAFVLFVGDRGFDVPSGTGDLVGQQLTVGPRKLEGLVVRRIDRALPGSRTLRMLVQLRNPSKRAITKNVSFDTDLGSDSSTVVRATSSGDLIFNSRDRWGISSQDLVESPGDPVVAIVNYGKGRVARPHFHLGPYPEEDSVFTSFRIRIGPKQTRYMLLFTELSETMTAAANSVRKFNKKKLNNALLKGMGPKVRRNVLNWDLG